MPNKAEIAEVPAMIDHRLFFNRLLKIVLIYWAFMAELGFLEGIHAWQRLGF